MLSRLKEPLRKLKRRRNAIDGSIRLSQRPVLAGYTAEGSPYYSLSTPLRFRCPIDREHRALGITLFCDAEQTGGPGEPVEAGIVIDVDGSTRRLPLHCGANAWDTIAVDLGAMTSNNDRDHVDVTLRADGADRKALSLGELRLRRGNGAPIRKGIQGVSYPRSGHGLLANVLRQYFGPEFYYCEYYELGCHTTPCASPGGAHFQKNHDHQLTLDASLADTDYLIQFRRPLYSIVSNFFLAVREEDQPVVDTRASWRSFAIAEAQRWRQWMQKWVVDNHNPRTQTLVYESVMENPQEELLRAIEFFSPEHEPNHERLAAIIHRKDVRPRRHLDEFSYYDAGFFQDVEQRLGDVIAAAGISPVWPD